MLRLSSLNGIKRGKGVWKFNNSLLDNPVFCNNVRLFWEGWKSTKPQIGGQSLLDWWDEAKEKFKEIAINEGKAVTQKNRQNERMARVIYAEWRG